MIPWRPVATVVFLASLVAFTWGFAETVSIGTCASGGPYVIAQECPEHADSVFWLLFAGAIGAIVSLIVLFVTRMPWGLAAFGLFMVALGCSFLAGELTSDELEGTGWFLGPMFALFGALPLVAGLRIDRRMRREPDYRPPAHDELLDGFATSMQERRRERRAKATSRDPD